MHKKCPKVAIRTPKIKNKWIATNPLGWLHETYPTSSSNREVRGSGVRLSSFCIECPSKVLHANYNFSIHDTLEVGYSSRPHPNASTCSAAIALWKCVCVCELLFLNCFYDYLSCQRSTLGACFCAFCFHSFYAVFSISRSLLYCVFVFLFRPHQQHQTNWLSTAYFVAFNPPFVLCGWLVNVIAYGCECVHVGNNNEMVWWEWIVNIWSYFCFSG